jgi:hypothetical protein
MINMYDYCIEIKFESLKQELLNLLFDYYQMDHKFDKIKIYGTQTLKTLPSKIKTIKFDKKLMM